jgi:hypothetical protein
MKKNPTVWGVPVTGALLFATAVSAETDSQMYLDSTNRVTLSLRLGFNISGKFKGTGSTFAPGSPFVNPNRRTPHGDKYNYADGYVFSDLSGSKDGMTWYWGYDTAGQVNASGANTIDLHRTTASGIPGETSQDDSPRVGAELAYDYQFGVKEDWHHLRYGVEAAFNWMPIEFGGGGIYNATLSRLTDTYGYTPGTHPPSAELPYQGSFQGPGFVLNVPRVGTVTTVSSATFLVQQHFDADLWGFRLGPYIEYPLSKKWSLHLSGGLAVGLLAGDASWKETLTLPGGGGSSSVGGAGDDVSVLWGFYVGLDAHYQMNQRWGLDAGVQFQDLGVYDHNFGGRTVEIDFSESLFVHAGISYSF